MSKPHVTPELALLYARDVRVAGGPAPANPERWTRAEANRIYQWIRTQPGFGKAMGNADAGRYVRLGLDVVEHFRFWHLPDGKGGASPWPRAAFIPDEKARDPFANATPEAVASYLAYADANPTYRLAMRDPKHPQHDALVQQTRTLRRIAASVPDEGAQEAAPAATDAGRTEAITQLQHDEAYRNARHPQHAAAVARMAALYEDTARPAPLGRGQTVIQEDPQETISRIQKDVAYWDKRHPNHAARVAEMQRAYEVARPAAQAADAGGGGASVATPAGQRRSVRPASAEAPADVIGRIQKDAAYHDKRHPDHAARVAEMRSAYEAAYPAPAGAEGGDHAA